MARQTPGTLPVPGFETPLVLRNIVSFDRFFRRMIPTLIFLVLLAALICGPVLGAFGLGSVRWAIALAAGVAFGCLLYVAKRRQFEASWPASTLELSPRGVISVSGELRVELPWPDIHEIGRAQLLEPVRVNLGNAVASAVGAVFSATMSRSEDALIGAGVLTLGPGAPISLRAQVAQNDRGLSVVPETGQPVRSIILNHFETDWRNGQIGRWIAAYRPDLLRG